MKLGDSYESFLIEKFGKTFQDIMNSTEKEKYEINTKLWDYLENDTEDIEASLLANHILLKWGKYDIERGCRL